ncbi:MAG TPA: hypothetical protein VHY30_09825 [Verrucomicrobiae bacterium]|jgi:hypothetical protein|nr:hypothetical protein [Verrucomicrobiae bacterium]
MHIQQTKVTSRATGGPQYYFHSVSSHVKEFLRKRGACPVVLQTPYGIASSSFTAVGRDHKISEAGKIIAGKVGHDRIQGEESIGEAIRYWYGLKGERDFERIDLDVAIHPDGHFILIPTAVTMRGAKRAQTLEKVISPLSFHHDYQSKFWKKQIEACRKESANDVSWAGSQIRRVVTDHRNADTKNVHEADLLRAAGALSIFGLDLSLYLTKGYDCPKSRFSFSGFPIYPCPVEIKKFSSRFDYQILRYTELPRAVVLCIEHDLVNPPDHVDILELSALADYLRS